MEDNQLMIGVCDDQKIWRDALKEAIYDFCTSRGIEYVQKEYSRAEEVLEAEKIPDILFLDIEMDGMTGIELKECLEGRKKARIVFVTSHPYYVMEAFGKDVFGFLEKPIKYKAVEKYMERMIADFNCMEWVVMDSVEGKRIVMLDDIIYFKAEKKYSCAYTDEESIFNNIGLGLWAEKLEKQSFFRCHKSYLINLKNVYAIKKGGVIMSNREKIPCGRSRKKELIDAWMHII